MLGRGGTEPIAGGIGRGGGATGTAGLGAGAAGLGAGAAGLGAGAAGFGAGFFTRAFALAFAGLRAAFFAGRFFLAATFNRAFLRAGAAFLAFLPFAFFAFFAFDFFAIIDLPMFGCLAIAHCRPDRLGSGRSRDRHWHHSSSSRHPARPNGQTALPGLLKAPGIGPPVAQSINSIGWTTGMSVPAAIWVMQPTLPAAITSGATFAIFAILRSRNALANCGCSML